MANRAIEFGPNQAARWLEYRSWLDRLVLAARRRGIDGFGGLVRALPGVDPSEVRASLLRIGEAKFAREPHSAVVRGLWAASAAEAVDPGSDLPVPHPLDFDWRFDLPTRRSLLDRSERLAEGAELVCLGTPTVFFEAVKTGSSIPFLLDGNDATTCAAARHAGDRVLRIDVADSGVPDIQAGVVVSDPPWYPDHMFAFMWLARRLLAPNGHLLLTLPPVGTRPGIVEERRALFAWGEALGLTRLRVEAGAARYISPLYEWNALRVARLADVPLDWRAGDLVVFRRGERGQPPGRPNLPTTARVWREVELQGVRLRIRARPASVPCAPALRSLVPGEILPSVSRRDTRRREADVWTSGNRVFACDSPSILADIATGLATGESALERVTRTLGRQPTLQEVQALDGCYRQLQRLVERERRDRLDYDAALAGFHHAIRPSGE